MPGSPAPQRSPQGYSTGRPDDLMGDFGLPNPMGYHVFKDDFSESLAVAHRWTKTLTGNGTIANAATPEGGRALFTTNSSTPAGTDIASIQAVAACMSLTLGSKLFFGTRLRVASAVNVDLLVGLIQTTATPFTVADGLYLIKPTGAATGLVLRHTVGSVNQSVTIPTAAYTLADNTDIELGFSMDRTGLVRAWVGPAGALFGYKTQSGVSSSVPQHGPVATMTISTLTAVILNPTLAIRSGAAASTTMTADFGVWAKER